MAVEDEPVVVDCELPLTTTVVEEAVDPTPVELVELDPLKLEGLETDDTVEAELEDVALELGIT